MIQAQGFLLVMLMTLCAAQQGAAQEKPAVAVLTLKNANGVSDGEAQIITDRLRIELFKTRNVEVMEREQMKVILEEQGFQTSGACSDEGCMVEMGQMLGVQYMITGSIGRLGSLYMVNCRSVNVATAKIERVVSVDIKGHIEDVVGKLQPIAWKLTSGEAPPAAEPEREVVQQRDEEKDTDEENNGDDESGFFAKTNAPFKCDGLPVLEVPLFKPAVSFNVEEGTVENICEFLQEALQDCFRKNVRVASAERIAELGEGCKSPVVRVKTDLYSTKPSAMGQFIGTATVTVSVYDMPRAAKPSYAVKIQESGDRHWGEQTPLENAFEEIGSTLESEAGRSDYMKNYRRNR